MSKPILVLEPGLTAGHLLEAEDSIPNTQWYVTFLDWLHTVLRNEWVDWLHCCCSLPPKTFTDRINGAARPRRSQRLSHIDLSLAFMLLAERTEGLEDFLFGGTLQSFPCECSPNNVLQHNNQELVGMTERMLACVARYGSSSPELATPRRVVSRIQNIPGRVAVRYRGRNWTHVGLVAAFDDFLDCLGEDFPAQLFERGLASDDSVLVASAIGLKMRAILKHHGRPCRWERDLPTFGVGTDFIRSFENIDLLDVSYIFRRFAELVLKVTGVMTFGGDVYNFRPTQVSPERRFRRGVNAGTLDGGSRFRINPNYRLNFWECAQGPELAWAERHVVLSNGNVLAHLPNGDPHRTYWFPPTD
ncbi:MAG: hypothetical protein V2B18_25730 [Pseudomonadota bacterium]